MRKADIDNFKLHVFPHVNGKFVIRQTDISSVALVPPLPLKDKEYEQNKRNLLWSQKIFRLEIFSGVISAECGVVVTS